MRRSWIAVPLLAFCAFILANCSSDSSTQPPLPEGDDLLAEAVVDAAGDTMSVDGMVVEIPAGALAEDRGLRLLREQEPTLVGDTDTYRLEGLPADFAEPIVLTLPAADGGDPVGGDPVAYVQLHGVTAAGDTSAFFDVVPAVDVDGGISVTVAPGEYMLPAAGDKSVDEFILDLILTGVRETGRSHSAIPLPISIVGDNDEIPFHRELLLGWLVEDAERFLELSDQFRQTMYPSLAAYMPLVECTLNFSSYAYSRVEGYLQRPEAGAGSVVPRIVVTYNPEGGASLEALRQQLHFVFWRLVYEARTALRVDWWFYATVYELADDIDQEPPGFIWNFSPSVMLGLSRMVLEESDPWTLGMAPYGYGMVHLARWIDRHEGVGWGREALAATVNERAGYGHVDVEHLADALPTTPDSWWPAFLQDMMQGLTWPLDWERYAQRIDETWTMDGVEDQVHTFSGEQYRLDTRLYRIDLERDDFTAVESLHLSAEDPRDQTVLVVFSLDDGQLTPVGRGRTVEVEQLDVLAALDEDLIVLTANAEVTGDYQTSRDIQLTAMLDNGQGIPDVTTFEEISITVVTDNTYASGQTYHNEHLYVIADVAWIGNGLYAADPGGGDAGSDTVSVHIDPATLAMGGWSGSSINSIYSFDTRITRLAGTSVPVDGWGVDQYGTEWVRWVIRGDDEVCSRLLQVHYEEWYDDDIHLFMVGHECRETEAIYDTSSIHILAVRRSRSGDSSYRPR